MKEKNTCVVDAIDSIDSVSWSAVDTKVVSEADGEFVFAVVDDDVTVVVSSIATVVDNWETVNVVGRTAIHVVVVVVVGMLAVVPIRLLSFAQQRVGQ